MFTDKGIEGAGLFALPEEAVKASGAEYYVLDELPPEPSYMAVQKLVDEFKASGADLIVACGRRLRHGRSQAGKRAGDR